MFVKIFTQILDGSIAEDPALRHFFMDMLLLADADGRVDMTPSAISLRIRTPLKQVMKHLATLSAPDVNSRSPEYKGCRIALLDSHRNWGWVICNYMRFRLIASDEQRRESTRDRVASFRARNAGVKIRKADVTEPVLQNIKCNADVTHRNACNAKEKEKEKNNPTSGGVGGVTESAGDEAEAKVGGSVGNRIAATVESKNFQEGVASASGSPVRCPDPNQAVECVLGATVERRVAVQSPVPVGFETFWQAYPKKIGKGAAIKSYQRARGITNLEAMLSAIAHQRDSEQWCKDGGQFVPNPATWLNQMRWEDQLTVDVRKPKAEKSLAMKILESL